MNVYVLGVPIMTTINGDVIVGVKNYELKDTD